MRKKVEVDALEQEAKKLGYAELLQRVSKELTADTPIRAILEDRRMEIIKRLKVLEGGNESTN